MTRAAKTITEPGDSRIVHPRRMAFEIANRCNIHCSICDHPLLAQERKPLATQLILAAVEDAASLGTREITISGGEPLLHPGIDEIIAFIRSRRIQQILISNGTLLTPEKIDHLLQLGVNRFVISANGREEMDDAIRGSNVHARARKAMEYLIHAGHGARLSVNITICRTNFDALEEIRSYFLDLGARSVTFSVFSPFFLVRDVERKTAEFGLTPAQLEKSLRYLGSVEGSGENRQKPCGHVLNSCVVHSSGMVAPCWNYDTSFNLKTSSLRDIIVSRPYQEYAGWLHGKPDAPCETCYLACYNLVNSRLQPVVPLLADRP